MLIRSVLYLQGGPGFGCPPIRAGGWQDYVMDKGYKLLLLDTRGSGLSNTVTTELLLKRGGPKDQASFLKLFRADNIVNDAESIRLALTDNVPEGNKKWSVLGQSFGGFCAVHYLSKYPDALREVFTTGGLPPPVDQPDSLYAKLVRRVKNVSEQYYEKFPEDVDRVHRIIEHVSKHKISTFTGGSLTAERIQNLGLALGASGGSITLHDLILRMDTDLETCGSITRPTMSAVLQQGSFDDNILYALVHEAAYLSGAASNWSAERMLQSNPGSEVRNVEKGQPIMFTAEMVSHYLSGICSGTIISIIHLQ